MIRPSLLLLSFLLPVAGETRVEFNRDIRPILTKHCTACHGGVKEAGEVSFIYREKALAPGESGKAPIVPGKPAESEMLHRMRSKDPDEVMPKPKHGPPLPEAEIALIERWIAQGAEWQEHWAFMPPKESPVAAVSNEKWPSSPLDRFVLQRLDQEKLSPSPEAPPEEWLRRVSFDLTGLPPSPEDLKNYQDGFAKDPATARNTVVDRLLASQQFGERWAAVWLDLARYSDTYGFEKDPGRDIWPFRDWVIRALNADMPYDRFTIEQLAGDLLPDATADQRLATAFHRNTQTNTEGGTDDEEFRIAAVIDRSTTTWTTWQATTFGCVQCHSHPYDPIEHDEFYQFLAFFNNTEDHDQDNDSPRMKVPADPAKFAEASSMETNLRNLREQLNAPGQVLEKSTTDWKSFTPDTFAPSHGKLAVAGDGTIRSEGTLPIGNIHKFSGPATGFNALRLRILPEEDDPKKWPERGAFVSKFQVSVIDPAGVAVPVAMKEVFADRLGDLFDPSPGGEVGAFPKLEGPRWFVFVPEKPVEAAFGSRLEISMTQNAQTAGNQATPARRFALEISKNPEWTLLVNEPQRLATWKSRDEIGNAYKAIPGEMVPVMAERAPRETRVFARGNRLMKEHVVATGVPKLLADSRSKEGMSRLDMARWIASKENPLTSRVMVNRLWGELFGTGIVQTAEDFGTSGTPPSHPELLDHLALRFENDFNWSIKSMLREMVLSSTYRQTHNASKSLVARDPNNRLLARGPRNRLSAEMVRDQALAAAGLLSTKMGGPPVFPPQPAGVWRSVYNGSKWEDSKGEDRYRRGIYTYSKRTSGFPGFLTFDAPSRDLCSARRLVSNTPLQALVTMNDPAHIEAAQGLAKRMSAHPGNLAEQLSFGVLLATQETAPAPMLAELASLHAAALSDYQADPTSSSKLAAAPEAAAMALVANTILNLDSALTR
ncbi:PSD1 domain-containing protein [Luteolibacter yonseiensis]|uniref:PSD1 domain-containing protein n=1 Tax=Luteolibacter yonseiensis TaxID=1144680 RepID=A0A934R443_9BACT|nr:PSD1 and planctomycete cytochrome C domain-containing protein [Luteolibacter yonseiensis]MBK1815926.1 PSD1 domain-containing protein [Luteolibacter yonseiensis]